MTIFNQKPKMCCLCGIRTAFMPITADGETWLFCIPCITDVDNTGTLVAKAKAVKVRRLSDDAEGKK